MESTTPLSPEESLKNNDIREHGEYHSEAYSGGTLSEERSRKHEDRIFQGLPVHVGIIMDGNRRWAKRAGMMKKYGHLRGADMIEPIIECALHYGLPYLSAWALAKKNIENRTPEELADIYRILEDKVPSLVPKCIENGVRMETVGDLSLLPESTVRVLQSARAATAGGTRMTFVLAIAYGGQDEIVRGIRRFFAERLVGEAGDMQSERVAALDEAEFGRFLDTGVYPSIDLMIRTGGDMRHSGFFLYTSEYTEYYFTETLWPDFTEGEFLRAMEGYQSAKRNFGK